LRALGEKHFLAIYFVPIHQKEKKREREREREREIVRTICSNFVIYRVRWRDHRSAAQRRKFVPYLMYFFSVPFHLFVRRSYYIIYGFIRDHHGTDPKKVRYECRIKTM